VVGTRDSSAEPDVPPPPETTDPADQNRGETAPPQTDCVLPLSRQTYLQSTATTSADLDALAPPVTEQTSRQVRAADPDLDADLADWADWACTRPKAALLGPVSVTAQGRLPDRNPRLAWNTEVVAYLATRPRPVTSERYGTDLWPDDLDITGKTKVRQSIAVARAWLGTTLRTGHLYLPTAQAGAHGSYRIEHALVDAELLRWLRLRGTVRGADGITDLHAALDLSHWRTVRRAEERLDHEYAAMIFDVAHLVAACDAQDNRAQAVSLRHPNPDQPRRPDQRRPPGPHRGDPVPPPPADPERLTRPRSVLGGGSEGQSDHSARQRIAPAQRTRRAWHRQYGSWQIRPG